jgi:MoaD family protein
MMTITVKFFATYRDITGTAHLAMQVDEAATVADVIAQLEQQYPTFGGKLTEMSLVALNEKYTHRTKELSPHDVVALFPPVSGG